MLRSGLFWFALACAFVLTLALLVLPARSHSPLYDMSCCNDRDCKPVPDGTIIEKPDGMHVKGHGILSRTDPRIRWSRDEREHLCVDPQGKLLCIYPKPNGT
jgi:hypothetical protein